MTKWEYHLADRDELLSGEELDQLGEQGWELVTLQYRKHYGYHYIFKKPL